MKDAREVLQRKEADLARVRHEVDSLRLVAPLVAEEDDRIDQTQRKPAQESTVSELRSGSEATGTDGSLPSSTDAARPKFWNVLARRT